jgi:uncharacterized phage protein (TIGR02218 family)
MRTLPAGLREHLDSGATSLCHCWRLETRAGDVMGFTDHDRDVAFDGVTYEAQAGFTASEIESSLGLSVDNLDAAGALTSDRLSEARLKAGDFDHAEVEVWRVNWQDPAQRLLMRKGHLGEVSHGTLGFTAEVRGLAHLLDQPKGRLFQFGCDAVLGDQRCTVNLELPAFKGTGTVTAVEDNRRFTVSGLGLFDDGWFARGTIEWTSGANAGRGGAIKFHRRSGTTVVIELWRETAFAALGGDGFIARAGCDKQFSTCQTKFANTVNYRGFPHIPGDDFVLSYATKDDPRNDGGKR